MNSRRKAIDEVEELLVQFWDATDPAIREELVAAIYRRLCPVLMSWFRRWVDPRDMEDVVHDFILQFLLEVGEDGPRPSTQFLWRLVRNRGVDYLRRKRARIQAEQFGEDVSADKYAANVWSDSGAKQSGSTLLSSRTGQDSEHMAILMEMLKGLTERDYSIFYGYLCEIPRDQIAADCGVSETTVVSRIVAIRKMIWKRLSGGDK